MFSKKKNFLAEQAEGCVHSKQLNKSSKTTEFTKIFLEILIRHQKAIPLSNVFLILFKNKLDSDLCKPSLPTLLIITMEGVIITFSILTLFQESKHLPLMPLTIIIASTLHILMINNQSKAQSLKNLSTGITSAYRQLKQHWEIQKTKIKMSVITICSIIKTKSTTIID
jgi:hypothetical protein